MNIPILVAQKLQQTTKEVGQAGNKLKVRNRVEKSDPPDKELASEGIDHPYAFFEKGNESR